MSEYEVRYRTDAGVQSLMIDVGRHGTEEDAVEQARDELTAENPDVGPDDWDIMDARLQIGPAFEVRVQLDTCSEDGTNYVAYLDDDRIHLTVHPGEDDLLIELSHGYAPGSPQYDRDETLFAENEQAIREAANVEFERVARRSGARLPGVA